MQIKTDKVNSANATIQATIGTNEIEANADKLAKQLSKDANIAGFRKGKVPVAAVKKHYGSKLTDDAQAQTLREAVDTALAEMGIQSSALIGEPQVTKFDKKEDGIDVEIKLSIRPQIELGDYAALIESFEKPQTSEEEVEERINAIAKTQAPTVDVEEDRALAEGDIANIDFEGFLNGEAFEGGKAEGFALEVGSGQFIPGFEEQIVGMKKGDDREITVTFPQNYGTPTLAGKETVFKIELNAIQEKGEITIDDELAKKLVPGDKEITVEKLKEQIKTQLENEKIAKLYNETLKPQLLEKLVESIEFDLPEFIVEQEIDMAVNKKAQTMSEEELNTLKESHEKIQELRDSFKDEAATSVKATFIVDALAKEKNIQVPEQEVMQTIYYEAMQMGQDPKQTYEQYQQAGYLPAIQMAMIEDRVLSVLLDEKLQEAQV
jgi:trigger factor